MAAVGLMKAVRLYAYGDPEVLVYEDVPRPAVRSDEVFIRVHAASVNPVDWKTRRGQGVAHLMPEFPLTLGWDVSGRVVAVNTENSPFREGDDVYGLIRFPLMGAAYAEYATAPIEHLAKKPTSVDYITAAAVPLAALTAWQALFAVAQVQAGQRVLIHAAAGGVGHFAVQLAKWKGGYVIGTASKPNHSFLRELGIDEVIDYATTAFEAVVDTIDLVLDCVGGDMPTRSYEVLKRGGTLITIPSGTDIRVEEAQAHGVRAEWMLVQPNAQQLRELADLIDAGAVRPVVSHVLPLAEAQKAHQLSEAGHVRGKIVLRIGEE